ncbi:MAG: YifB family Mg chelatase-like AAA ATPase [Candidatus Schekmanbacteria bacterium]|nr:YifB family Mg chelatase-like AAA ATPase [Candidatus Schekmanbacteria bacterium]
MFSVIESSCLQGVEAWPVRVETDIRSGLPALNIVGLPDAAVRESRERVRAAITSAGYNFPARRITVNLAPANHPKDGTDLDLAIALGIVAADGAFDPDLSASAMVVGELSLDGQLRPVRGVLPRALLARELGKELIVPSANSSEAVALRGLSIRRAATLGEIVSHFVGGSRLPLAEPAEPAEDDSVPPGADLSAVRGQSEGKRAVMALAAGGHNVLLCGPPGTGKSLLASCIPGILPPLTAEESLEVTAVYSAAGLLPRGCSRVRRRPFRAPHHSSSDAAMVGGGPELRPGELTLAHRGVLFLDELAEFHRNVLEAMRAPLEDGALRLARARRALTLPARCSLVAAMNPCPCGSYAGRGGRQHAATGGTGAGECRCLPGDTRRYQARVSGPLLDRFDALIGMAPISPDLFFADCHGPGSAAARALVIAARERQRRRYAELPGVTTNAELPAAALEAAGGFGPREQTWLFDELRGAAQMCSPRGIVRIARLARTLADLGDRDAISREDVQEAAAMRFGASELLST